MKKCIRCKAALPDDSSFCAACGYTDHAAIAQRAMNAKSAVGERIARGRFRRAMSRILRGFRWKMVRVPNRTRWSDTNG